MFAHGNVIQKCLPFLGLPGNVIQYVCPSRLPLEMLSTMFALSSSLGMLSNMIAPHVCPWKCYPKCLPFLGHPGKVIQHICPSCLPLEMLSKMFAPSSAPLEMLSNIFTPSWCTSTRNETIQICCARGRVTTNYKCYWSRVGMRDELAPYLLLLEKQWKNERESKLNSHW